MLKKLRLLPIIIITLVMGFIAFSPVDKAEADNRIADGVFLGSQDLSGMNLTEAVAAMEKYYDTIAASNLKINIRDIPADVLKKIENGEAVNIEDYNVIGTVEVPISTFGFEYSIEEALHIATTLGQTGKLVERYKILMDMKYASAQLPLSYSIDGEKVKDYIENVFAPGNTKEPVDAKFTLSEGRVVATSGSQNGVKVNANLTTSAIMKAFEDGISDHMSCTAIVGTIEPRVTSDAVNSISGVVAKYSTNFWTYDSPENENRSENIRVAAQYVNGTMVMPGERVSLNEAIGIRTEERGFKVGHAYRDGRVIDDVGGGICQFVTTLYQCVLQTEMQVNVRHNHSMRVDYVDYSQDATVNWPNVDMVFTNTWKYPVYITCSVSFGYPSSVTVSFYSYDERPSNRTVEYRTVVDATDKTVYPQLVVDKSKAAGNPTSSGVVLDAVSSHIEKIVRVGGVEQSRTRMNNDYYRPLRKIITVGGSGLGLEVSRVNDIDQIRDSNGNYLLLDSNYKPIYNGRGGYYLAKDYKHGANNVATYSGGSLVPVGGGSTTHTHSFTNWKSNGDGTHTATCSCGDKKTEDCTFNSKGKCTVCGYTKPTEPSTTEEPVCSHTWNKGEVTKAATCTAKGVKTYTCTKCGAKKTEEIPALDHSWDSGKVTKQPTCTTKGEKIYTCTKCGATKPEEIPATGQHSYGDWSGWSSNNNGTHSRSHSCTVCHDAQSETENCTYSEVVTPPTTTSQGYTTHTCQVCGYSFVDSYTDPLQPPTETEPDPEPTEPVAPVDLGSLVLAEKLRRHFLFY